LKSLRYRALPPHLKGREYVRNRFAAERNRSAEEYNRFAVAEEFRNYSEAEHICLAVAAHTRSAQKHTRSEFGAHIRSEFAAHTHSAQKRTRSEFAAHNRSAKKRIR
jgi:hypothetical protein